MRQVKVFYIVCFVSLINLTGCFSFLCAETKIQFNDNVKEIVNANSGVNDGLLDMKWTLVSIKISDSESFSFSYNGNYSTLELSSNGSYSGKAICNTMFGNYTIVRNYIKFGNPSMTRVNCDNNTESLIRSTLGEINNYAVYDKKLFLKRDSEILMIYELNKNENQHNGGISSDDKNR